MWKYNNFDEIYHYGIPGMRWGHRKAAPVSSSIGGPGRRIKKPTRYEKRISSIKDYNKKYNSAERASNAADKKWDEANALYKKLGKNRIQRIINAAKGKTADAKKYSKLYDEASRMEDAADKQWDDAKKAYKKTGANAITRVINNAKYDINKNKKKKR
jgi:hypothetical protein